MADAGLKLKVEGEAEFKKALKEVNDELKVNQSELKLLAEQYKVNNQDINTLSERQKAYSERLETTKEKVSLIKDEIAKASDVYGENSKVVQDLTIKYNNAQAEVVKLTAEYEKAEKEVENVTNATADYNATMESLSDAYKTIEDPIEANIKAIEILKKAVADATKEYGENTDILEKYQDEIKKAEDNLDSLAKTTDKNREAVEEYRKEVDEANKEPWQKTLESVDDLLGKLGVKLPMDLKSVEGGFADVATSAGTIALAVGGAIKLVEELGESLMNTADRYKDLYLKSFDKNFDETEYLKLEYAASKAGISSQDFGKILDTLGDKVKEYDKKIGSASLDVEYFNSLSQEECSAINKARAEWDKFGVALYDSNGELRQTNDIFEDLINVTSNMSNKTERLTLLQELFGKSASKLIPLTDAGADSLRKWKEEAVELGLVLTDLEQNTFTGISIGLENWQKKLDMTKEKFNLLWPNIFSFESWINGNLKTSWDSYWKSIKGLFKGHAAGTTFYPGGFSLVGEYGPEIVSLPRGSKIYPNGVTPNIPTGTSSNVYNITIDAKNVKEFNDIVELAQSARIRRRMY